MIDVASGRIVGHIILSAGRIERAFLPKPRQRNTDSVLATLLGQLVGDSGGSVLRVVDCRRLLMAGDVWRSGLAFCAVDGKA